MRSIESGGEEDVVKSIVKLADNNSAGTQSGDWEITEKQVTDEMLARDEHVGMQTTGSSSIEENMEEAGCHYAWLNWIEYYIICILDISSSIINY